MMKQPIIRSERQCHDLVRSCTPLLCEGIVFTAVQAICAASTSSVRRRARRERETQGANNAHDRNEFGIAGLSQSLVEALAPYRWVHPDGER